MTIQHPANMIANCKKGNQEAFAILCEIYYDYIFRIAFRMMASEDDAKDITHETLIKVWNNIKSYNPKVKFTTWLYRVVTNHCIDELRKQRNHKNIICEEALSTIDTDGGSDIISNTELASIISCLSKDLSPKQRAIFTLRDLEGLEMDEISEILNIPTSAVKSNLYYARKNIRQILITQYKVEY